MVHVKGVGKPSVFQSDESGRRRHVLRAIVATQGVKMEALDSALQTWEEMVTRHNQKNANIGAVERAEDIKCRAVGAIVRESLKRRLQLNARRVKICRETRIIEVFSFFESCTGKVVRPRTRDESSKAGSGYDPIDTLIKGKLTGKSKGKGKEDGKQSTSKGKGPSDPKI